MRIRLHGTPEECHEAASHLATVCEVTAVSPPYVISPPYPGRSGSGLVHVYLDVRLPDQPDPHDQHDHGNNGSGGSLS
ncbi:MAG: hypothetical protein GEV12_23410 [Micromonosporaceae bacterium]|nr:hypothetical protein [Micromonosporaceae bacterium]